MRNIQILLIFCLGFGLEVFGQNLVPNGNFELGPNESSEGWLLQVDNTCSSNLPINGPDFWTIVNYTPDRMFEGDIPCNWDNDTAQSGSAYCIFGYQEAGKVSLSLPMKKDSIYRLDCYLSLESFRGLGMEPNYIEFRFNNGGNILPSSVLYTPMNWIHFDTTFIALENSTELEVRGMEPLVGYSAVKVDNISLTRDDNAILYNLTKEKIKIFPNPVINNLNIYYPANISIDKIELYNSQGVILSEIDKNNNIPLEMNVSNFPKGFYLLKMNIKNLVITKSFIIN